MSVGAYLEPLVGELVDEMVLLKIDTTSFPASRNFDLKDIWMVVNDLNGDFVILEADSLLKPFEDIELQKSFEWYFEIHEPEPPIDTWRKYANLIFKTDCEPAFITLIGGDKEIFYMFAERLSQLCGTCVVNWSYGDGPFFVIPGINPDDIEGSGRQLGLVGSAYDQP
jgi:hypothetical protein